MGNVKPDRLGRFKLISLVGAGGMGMVYRGEDSESGAAVAVKVLPEAFSKQAGYIERFKREARIYMGLSHESIPHVHDFGVQDGRYYLAMDWIDGMDMGAWIVKRAGLPDNSGWLKFFEKICAAVRAAHEQGVLHRDLKAENIIVLPNGDIRIIDFGLSKTVRDSMFTMTGQMLGTPQYSAPEQIASSKDALPASDIWSLGVLGYVLATGRLPFDAEGAPAILQKILNPDFSPPPARSINTRLSVRSDSVLQRCLERNLQDRYAAVSEIQNDLSGPAALPVRGRQSRLRYAATAALALVRSVGSGFFSLAIPSIHMRYQMRRAVNPGRGQWIDLNRASQLELTRIDGFGRHLADQIVIFRDIAGPIRDIQDIGRIPGLTEERLTRLKSVSFAGSNTGHLPARKKINLNSAALEELQETFPQLYHRGAPGEDPWADVKRLIDHRERHGPFRSVEEVSRVEGFPRSGKKFWLVAQLATVDDLRLDSNPSPR